MSVHPGHGCLHQLKGLHRLEGLHQLGVCRHQLVDCCILLDRRVGQMLEGCGDLASLRLLFSCVGPECSFGRRHVVDVPHFGKGSSPVRLPIVVGHRSAAPLPPCQGHVPGRKRMFGARRDHRGFGNGDSLAGGKTLALFLFHGVDGKGESRIHADVELDHIVVHVGLADLGICQ